MDTKPERIVRSMLHRLGYRFTVKGPKNHQLLPAAASRLLAGADEVINLWLLGRFRSGKDSVFS